MYDLKEISLYIFNNNQIFLPIFLTIFLNLYKKSVGGAITKEESDALCVLHNGEIKILFMWRNIYRHVQKKETGD